MITDMLARAAGQAQRLGVSSVGEEEVLLALAEAGSLERFGVNAASVRDEVMRLSEPDESPTSGIRTTRAWRATEARAEQIGLQRGHERPTDEDWLLSLLWSRDYGASILRDHGLRWESAKEALCAAELLAEPAAFRRAPLGTVGGSAHRATRDVAPQAS